MVVLVLGQWLVGAGVWQHPSDRKQLGAASASLAQGGAYTVRVKMACRVPRELHLSRVVRGWALERDQTVKPLTHVAPSTHLVQHLPHGVQLPLRQLPLRHLLRQRGRREQEGHDDFRAETAAGHDLRGSGLVGMVWRRMRAWLGPKMLGPWHMLTQQLLYGMCMLDREARHSPLCCCSRLPPVAASRAGRRAQGPCRGGPAPRTAAPTAGRRPVGGGWVKAQVRQHMHGKQLDMMIFRNIDCIFAYILEKVAC